MNVMIEPTSVASQAGQRNTASITSSATTGIRATRHVSNRLSSGLISCENMVTSPGRGLWLLLVASKLHFVPVVSGRKVLARAAVTQGGAGNTRVRRVGLC